MPEISVIMPVYNQAEFLGTAVRSVLAQDYADFELILVDDGSTDGSGEMCDAFAQEDGRVLVIHRENAGAAAARNAGLDDARGTWIAFVDADDYIGPSYLGTLHFIAVGQNVEIVIAPMEEFDGEPPAGPQESAVELRLISGREACMGMYSFYDYGFMFDALWGKIYRRELFQTLRLPAGKTREDAAIMHELLYPHDRIALIKGCCYGYRDNPASVMSRPISTESFDALEAFEARTAYYERVGEDELAEYTRETLRLWRAMLCADAHLVGRDGVVPERWRMDLPDMLNVLGDHTSDSKVMAILSKLLARIRTEKSDAEKRVHASQTISVIMPVYNQAEFLVTAVRSVLAQDHRNLDIILVDDGSTDGSDEMCDAFAQEDSRIRVIHQENAGLSAARNAGLEIAHGTWLAFIDSDDAVGPHYLSTLLDAATGANAEIAIAQQLRFAGDPPAELQDDIERVRIISGCEACANMYRREDFIFDTAHSKLFKRSLFDTLRFPVGKRNEDAFISHLLLYPQERIAICEGCFYGYRINPNGIMAKPISAESFDILEALEERIAFYERMGDDELAKQSQGLLRWWHVMLVAEAHLAKRDTEVPERWRMGFAEMLRELGEHTADQPMASKLLAALLARIRTGKS